MTLSGFWHGAAALSARIDLSEALQQPRKLSHLGDKELSLCGVHKRHIQRLRGSPPLDTPQSYLTIEEQRYPALLRPLPYAPPVLFYVGNLDRLQDHCVAIVGARRCTQRARDLAATLSRELSGAGLSVVSGLAYGVDEAAHAAAPGQAIAVLGQGLGTTLTQRQRRSVDTILDAGGLILSEFLPHFPAAKRTFPQRNRVISGLSSGTVVIEATLRSGSLVTARHALEQGREVMAVPGHPLDPMSKGCNQLIASGAALITSSDDVLSCMGLTQMTLTLPDPQCTQQAQVLNALSSGETIDHIAAVTGMDIPTIMVALDGLELTGHVARLPGDRLQTRTST
jgi:DNA processing protein